MKQVLLIACLALAACQANEQQTTSERMVGGDRDNYGCIGSAGYQWCRSENQCVRSWELASEKGFENTGSEFKKYCDKD